MLISVTMKIPVPKNHLRHAEKKAMFIKLTKYLGWRFDHMMKVEQWQAKEIVEITGLTNSRITEIKDYEKYKRPINEAILAKVIGGGIVNVDELKEKANLDEKEKRYLETMRIYQDPTTRALYNKLVDAGYNPADILKDFAVKNNIK